MPCEGVCESEIESMNPLNNNDNIKNADCQ